MAERRTPGGPESFRRGRVRRTIKRTVKAFQDDNIGDWAAALTYYGSSRSSRRCWRWCRPWAIGPSATQPLIDNLETVAPGPASDIVTGAIRDIQKGQGTAGILFVVSLGVALWSASGYVAAFMRASNAVYGVEEGRPSAEEAPAHAGAPHRRPAGAGGRDRRGGHVHRSAGRAGGQLLGIGSEALAAWDVAGGP